MIREQSLNLESEYKKRLSELRLEIEKSSNEKISEGKKQADKIIKEAKNQSINVIGQARNNLNYDLINSIQNMGINEIKRDSDEISLQIKRLSNIIKSKVG